MKHKKIKSIIILAVMILTMSMPVVADGTRSFSVEHSDYDVKLWGGISLDDRLVGAKCCYFVHLTGDDLLGTDKSVSAKFKIYKRGSYKKPLISCTLNDCKTRVSDQVSIFWDNITVRYGFEDLNSFNMSV